MADFDGRSSLLYRFNQKSMSTVKDVISLRFKSRQAEGVLLHGEGQRGDYITLELHRGKLALYLNLGQSQQPEVQASARLPHLHTRSFGSSNKHKTFTVVQRCSQVIFCKSKSSLKSLVKSPSQVSSLSQTLNQIQIL